MCLSTVTELIKKLKAQITVQISTIKTKDKDLQVYKQEISLQKQEHKASLQSKDIQIDNLQNLLNSQTTE
jgi:hypothetical protein